eukprot:c6032_g1_i1.p1 GENE.c6032_g1_i1~~c6032_g1_i1.p1  ORF type:complete len:435 (+),score=95.03 c6032_g1_i1:39-1343(+)
MLGRVAARAVATRVAMAAAMRCPSAALATTVSPASAGSGKPKLDLFNPTEEHRALRETLRRFTDDHVRPVANEFNRTETLNLPLLRRLGSELGILGITVAEQYGGAGQDALAAVIAHEELASADPAFTLSYLAHSMLFVNNLHINGSEAQKKAYLPGACDGSLIGGMCMSEPAVGTDVLALSTTAKPDGGDYILNGAKMWITNAVITKDRQLGDVFLVYARTAAGPRGISLFLVEKGAKGFAPGINIKDKCGMRASQTSGLVLEDVRVPASAMVGELNGAAHCMMRNLEIERVTLAAMSLGIARRSIEVMNNYASERVAFGKPLREFGQTQRHLAESWAEYAAGRAYVYATAANLDLSSSGNLLDTDGVKLYCGPMAKGIADRAIQVLGGNGYMGEYEVERLWRDSKLLEIGGGTNESHQKNMTKVMRKMSTIL